MTGERGTTERDGDRCTLTFRRLLPTGPADLWDAITAPQRLARWFGARATVRPGVGGLVELRWDDGEQWVRGEILAWEPPRLLEYRWTFPGEDESVVRFEIEPADGGALLSLVHRRLGPAGGGYGPAWHAYLDRLRGLLEGEDID